MKSISLKISLLYIFLAIFNIALFTIIIFENQIDLITENTKYSTKETASSIHAKLMKQLEVLTLQDKIFSVKEVIDSIEASIPALPGEFLFYKENGDVLHQSSDRFPLTQGHMDETINALAKTEFDNDIYHFNIDETTYDIFFYIPLNTSLAGMEDSLLLFKLKMHAIDQKLDTLYRLVIIIIVFIAVFHILFAIVLDRLVILPIKHLSVKSIEISEGNLDARVKVKSGDEIGLLGDTFNHMADSVQNTIFKLDRQNHIMKTELQMAAKVQGSIYPDVKDTAHFNISVYHRPYIEVSGDFHNIIDLGDERFGVILADVSGHGVAAALITMMIKDRFAGLAKKYSKSHDLMDDFKTSFSNLMTEYDRYFTACYIIVEKNRFLSYSSAGHPHALVVKKARKEIVELAADGIFIGLPDMVNFQYDSIEQPLEPGDKIILYSDGITESLSPGKIEFEDTRLKESALKHGLLPGEQMLKNMVTDFLDFCDQNNRRDDETLIVIDIKDTEKKEA